MPTDPNLLAAKVVSMATSEDAPEPPKKPKKKNAAAVALGRKGGLKGGKARAESLSPEQRSEIARNAAVKRWERTPEENP